MSATKQQIKPLPILGTPLLYKVNADTIGNIVTIQNQATHTIAIQGTDFGGGAVIIEWSLDAVIWNPLFGNVTQNGIVGSLTYNAIYLRARLSGSKNAQNITVTIS